MDNNKHESFGLVEGETPQASTNESEQTNLLSQGTKALLQMGLGETLLRVSSNVLSVVALVVVIWIMQTVFRQAAGNTAVRAAQSAVSTASVVTQVASAPQAVESAFAGISRRTQIHTIIPSRPRQEVIKYVVQEGDTVFGIAEKFGLQPQTILWGNYATLMDDPHNLRPGQELNILPVDGTYYEWHQGDGLNGVAKYFGVKPEDIINYPGNHLDAATIGDFAAPNIKPGTMLIVPGGKREFVSWSAPLGVTRENAAYARVLGPGVCDPVSGGAVGFGTFVWPTNRHYLSGYDYSPATNHWGIDIAGSEGEGVFATDAGVVVYAGWNNYGYGNMIMIDHGRGWQSLYAHLSAIYVSCGQSVGQGEAIGAIGTTGNSSGPHLHFELMTSTYKVNPWDFLPPP
ncbi:MAG: peptidoglycan DD-metalloendopeptidase family protein [Anaerolineae bacterium]